eukprot:6200618-Pleurochrysis_carterae.AAC.1
MRVRLFAQPCQLCTLRTRFFNTISECRIQAIIRVCTRMAAAFTSSRKGKVGRIGSGGKKAVVLI